MAGGFANVFWIPDLRKRVLCTFGFLFVYRIGVYVPTPGIDSDALALFFANVEGTIFGMFNMFSGGALERFSIFVLGIMPYISASIIFQLLAVVVPYLEKLKNEGGHGKKKITQYTRYGTVVLSIMQGLIMSIWLENMVLSNGVHVVISPGFEFKMMTVLTLTAGTAFIMWLGEQITDKGIGNGISLIIFAGIITRIPSAVANTFRFLYSGEMSFFIFIIVLFFMVFAVGFIVFVEQGQRRITVQYPKRIVGRRMYGGQATHLPLKVNTSGVIPPIFASSIIMVPITLANFVEISWINFVVEFIKPGNFFYELLYMGLIFFFCYFYTAIIFNPVDVADNMRKNGGYVPGIRPGKKTADYIDRVLTRLTFSGAVYVSLVCVLPSVLVSYLNLHFSFGGTALLIVVGVVIDTVTQMESRMLTHRYEGFMKKGGIIKNKGQ